MTRADEFAKDMCGELEKHTRKNGITWTVGKREKGCHEVVDVQGRLKGDSLNARPRFLVEVELRRGQPLGNVIKIWKWFQRGPKGHTVIQAFSRFYRRNGQKGTRQLNAEF